MKLISPYGKRIGFCALAAAAMGASLAPAARGEPSGVAERLIGAALSEGRAYQIAESLTDGVGARPAGSDGAARAVTWAVAEMRALGLKNVHTEPASSTSQTPPTASKRSTPSSGTPLPRP